MAIKKFGDYESTQTYGTFQTLPKGAYVLKILGAKVKENSVGQYVELSCDIADGEFEGYFMNDYKNQTGEDKKWRCIFFMNVPNDDGTEQDGWTKRRFKTQINAIEDSNPGYHFDWDETKFKNKFIGGLFNIREYQKNNGGIGSSTRLAALCSVNDIKTGNYKISDDKLLPKTPSPSMADTGFMSIDTGVTDDFLPFN